MTLLCAELDPDSAEEIRDLYRQIRAKSAEVPSFKSRQAGVIAHLLTNMKKQASYAHLLTEQCSGIVLHVLGEMEPNRFHVGSTKPGVVPHEAILYRWWFPQNSPVMGVLTDFAK